MKPSSNIIALRTKTLVPINRKNLVQRPRLSSLLQQGIESRLTTLCAPAGFGKTTLLSQWIHQAQIPIRWLSLDERDNDLIRFWHYVLQSVLAAEPSPSDDRLEQLTPLLHESSIHTFLDAFLNQFALGSDQTVLIWDDFHFIQQNDLSQSISYFIEHLPDSVHLVITSRTELPFSTIKWTARKEHTEIDARLLQFTLEETEAYYDDIAELPLSQSQIDALHTRTEGWVTALQLISISLQTESDYDKLIDSFTGGHRALANYMFQEVMAGIPGPMLSFLHQTSMLDRFDAPLCQVVTGQRDSEQMLEQLKARNLFLIPLDEHNHWFRYHHLFAEYLQNQMKQQQPEQWLISNRAASSCLAERGFVAEAMDHAIAARDASLLEELLEQHASSLLLQGEFSALLRWLDSYSAKATNRTLEMSLIHAFVLVVTKQPARAESLMKTVEQRYELLPQGEQRQQLQCGLLFVKSNLLFTSGHFEQWLAFSQKSLNEMLPQSSIYYNFNYNRTEPLVRRTSFGMNGTLSADTERIAFLFTNTLKEHNWNESLINLYVLQSLCEGYYEWNRLHEAASLIPAIDRASRASGTPGLFVPNRITQALVHMAQDQLYLAHETIEEAFQTLTRERKNQHWKQALIACRIRLYLKEGLIPLARKELPKLRLSAKDRPVLSRYFEFMTLARLLGAQHKETQALRLLSLLRPQAQRENHLVSIIEITIVEAMLKEQLGQRSNALLLLHDALVLTEPFGYIRSYLDEGEKMLYLLQRYMQVQAKDLHPTLENKVSSDYVQRLIEQFPGRVREASPPMLSAHLSRGELELLRLIRQGETNREIAKTLKLSEGTVKVYASRIYTKLGVSSRTQALLVAQQLQLLEGE